jgi:hypothetical protein
LPIIPVISYGPGAYTKSDTESSWNVLPLQKSVRTGAYYSQHWPDRHHLSLAKYNGGP